MNKTFTILAVLAIHSICSTAQSIDSLTSPRVWLKADKSILNSNTWTDVGIFKNNAFAASTSETPQLTGIINYNKAIVFDGLDDYFKIPYSLEGLADFSILAVYQSTDTTERGIWGSEQSTSRNVLLTTRKAIGPDTIPDVYGKTEKITVLNSVLQNWEQGNATSTNSFFALGSAGKAKKYKPYKGSFAELIIFDKSLTFLERVQYETYLAIKYGTGLHGGNFVSSGEKVLWRIDENKTYYHNISGLGRDDYFGLYQKQTGSAYDSGLLVMSAGVLSNSNIENKAVISNQDFLIWGDNSLSMRSVKGKGIDSVLSFIQRKWLVTVNGNTAKTIPVEVYVDASKFPANALGYWLVIDRSGQGNFSVDNIEYVKPDGISNGKIVYKNVVWDKDGSGKDNFGFAQAQDLFAVVRTIKNPSCADKAAGKITIEVISGKSPYQFSLSNPEAKINRDWKNKELTTDQKELVAGNYTLQLSDDTDDKVTRKFSLAEPDALYITLGADQKLVDGNAITLDISEQIPDSIAVDIRWENNFGFNSTEKKVTVSESGIYRVFVTKEKDGCVFSDEVIISGTEQRIAVFPSLLKSNDNFNISISLEEPGSVTVRTMNSAGVPISTMVGSSSSEYQFISTVKDSGMYLVIIQTPKGIETRKIVSY
ncbi:MAG TPA: T9SS type A sorting domain-containing protein [Cyclobacteriaceae bacterium]|jgi:hypothetical protein|nr:T9SS type A sorting domain-containing protein [Cyclobacteriaceae bacterium]